MTREHEVIDQLSRDYFTARSNVIQEYSVSILQDLKQLVDEVNTIRAEFGLPLIEDVDLALDQ